MRRTIWVGPLLVWIGVMVIGLAAWLQLDPPPSQLIASKNASLLDQAAQTSAAPTPTVAPTPINLLPLPPSLAGVVVDANGPVAGAYVQIHGSPKHTTTAKNGAFRLTGISGSVPVVLTAWASGYYVGSASANPSASDWKGGQNLTIKLEPYNTGDNNKYKWFTFDGVTGSASCGICHREYREWLQDAHAQTATNPRFLSMYSGTDVKGNMGQSIQYSSDGKILPPDPSKPYYGPGFKVDNPMRAGNCATCHTPMASDSPNNQNCSWSGCHNSTTIERSANVIPPPAYPTGLKSPADDGISCDFCHKIGAITLDPKTKLPPPDMPGILSMQMFRPKDGQQLFFGTLKDVPRRDTYLALLSQSEYCAPCHYGVFGGVVGVGTVSGGTVIYNSYGEWLNSPYSDPKTGKTCQQCHMPKSSANWFVYPEQGGLRRDYATLHNHIMTGITDETLLQNSVTMKSQAQRKGDQVMAVVQIKNDQTGHDIPTDSPLRSMILVVEAFDASGKPLALSDGPVNPAYSGNYGGLPGKTFAKVLKDEWTGETPTGAYWRPVSVASDNRLAPLATDTTRYTFTAPTGETVTLKIHLLYRRAFQQLAEQKGWKDPDIVMEEDFLTIPAKP